MRFDPPVLTEGPLSRRVFVVTHGKDLGNGQIEATVKFDVTDQFEALIAKRSAAVTDHANPSPATEPPTGLGWDVISGEALLAMLRRCAAGEDPDMVYAEQYANADHERVEGDESHG